MTTLYASIEAAEVRCKRPDHCANCGGDNLACETVHVCPENICEMYWVCDDCSYPHKGILFVYAHSEHPILTETQVEFIIRKRREKDFSLRDIAEKTGIRVSRLSDFERRHDAPTPSELGFIMDVLGIRIL
jgi:hypothetical protein